MKEKLIKKYYNGGIPKYYGTYSPKDLAYILPRYVGKNGEINVGLPEVKVTPNQNTDLGTVMQGRGNFGKNIAEFTPVGDVIDIYNIGKNTYEGNYRLAALGAGLFFLPDLIAKPAKRLFRKINKTINAKKRIDDFEYTILPDYMAAMESAKKEKLQMAKTYNDRYNHMNDNRFNFLMRPEYYDTKNPYKADITKWKAENVKLFSDKYYIDRTDVDIEDTPKGVEITMPDKVGFNTNKYITSGQYSVPIFGTDKLVSGNITVKSPGQTKTINFNRPYAPSRMGSSSGIVDVPEEYTLSLQLNIEYLKKIFPGFKEFGSSAGVVNAGFPHSTHDIDGFISDVDFDKIQGYNKNVRRQNGYTGDVDTYLLNLDNKTLGEYGYDAAKDIDMNIIYTDPKTGKARGANARELYSQFFPDEYQNAVDLELLTGNFEINKTPLELLEAYNPTTKTIMDSFEIDFTRPGKDKHAGRPLVYLSYGNPQKVSEGLHLFAKSFVGSGVELPKMNPKEFSDINRNLELLNKWDIRGDLNAIARDPQKMQNAMDYWVLNTSVSSRAVDGINNLKDLHSAMTTWLPESLGGNANGAGLNSVQFGNSGYSGYYSMTLPHLDVEGKTPEEVTDYINRLTGQSTYEFTPEEKNIVSNILGSRGYDASTIQHPQDILNTIPSKGNEADLMLKEINAKLGMPFITKSYPFGDGLYRSFTAPFDLSKGHMHYRAPYDARPVSQYTRNRYIGNSSPSYNFFDHLLLQLTINRNTKRTRKPEYRYFKDLQKSSIDKLKNKYYNKSIKYDKDVLKIYDRIDNLRYVPNNLRRKLSNNRGDAKDKAILGLGAMGTAGFAGKIGYDIYSSNKYMDNLYWALDSLNLDKDTTSSNEFYEIFRGLRGRDFAESLKLLPPELAAQQLTDKVRQLQIKHLRKKK